MHTADLIATIAAGADLSRAQARRLLDTLTSVVSEALTAGEKVTLAGFGRFAVASRAARRGRNPHTGEELRIPARRILRFKAATRLQAAVQAQDRRPRANRHED